MIILAITLTAWAILRKYAQKKPVKTTNTAFDVSRDTIPLYDADTPHTPTQAELARLERKRERASQAAQREAAKQRKAEAERQQAAADTSFYIDQIDKLYSMLWDADAELQTARKTCQYDNEMNKNGAVIPEKIAAKHRADRDKLARRVMQLENSIHARETKLNKAQQIVQN